MDLSHAISERRSIRSFTGQKLTKDKVKELVEAGCWAPSGMNQQPWKFIAVMDDDLKRQLRSGYSKARERLRAYRQDTSFVEDGTPVVATYDRSKTAADISTSLACQNMMLKAYGMGLGSVIMTAPLDEVGEKQVRSLLDVPTTHAILAVMVFGFADERPDPKPRKDLDETLSFDRF